jgi:hypothetical protein
MARRQKMISMLKKLLYRLRAIVHPEDWLFGIKKQKHHMKQIRHLCRINLNNIHSLNTNSKITHLKHLKCIYLDLKQKLSQLPG